MGRPVERTTLSAAGKEAAVSSLGRRRFVQGGVLGSSALLSTAGRSQRARGANDRIGIACVGVGTRGSYLLEQARDCPNTEIRIVCDLYDARLQRAVKLAGNPKVQATKEWEKAITSKDVDAVIIATPDFWHAVMAIQAAQAGKDVYLEKALCRTLDEAKRIRTAVRSAAIVLQLGHQRNSDPYFVKARGIFESGQLGQVPLVRMYTDRSGVTPSWQFYGDYRVHEPPEDASPQTIDWHRFIANATERPYNRDRFFLWRYWWEYGTGIAGDLMSHFWDSLNMVMSLGVPDAVTAHGALRFYKQMEVPDQWHVMFDYPKRDLSVQFNCTFHNLHMGTNTLLLGRDATLYVSTEFCRLYDAEWKPDYRRKLAEARKQAAGPDPTLAAVAPVSWMKQGELEISSHMQDFLECVRSRHTPRCGMDRAFQDAATVVMSVESYFRERKVKWDPVNEAVL